MGYLNILINNDVGAPFIGASNFKEIDPVTGAALIAGGGSVLSSLLGGLFSSSSTSSTNSTNYAIAQMNNEYNSEQLQKLIDYNWDMWNADNEYNSASSQVERYLEAGLNPAIMMTSGSSAGSASSISAPSAAPAQNVTMQPTDYSFIGDAITNGVNAYNSINMSNAQSQLFDEQAEATRIENLHREEEMISRINQMAMHTKFEESQKAYQDLLTRVQSATADDDIAYAKKRNENIDAQTMLSNMQANVAIVQSQLGYKQLQYFDKNKQYEYSMTAANIQQAYTQGELSRAQAKKALADTYLSMAQTEFVNAQTKNVKVDTKQKLQQFNLANRLADSIVKQAETQAAFDAYQFEIFKRDNPRLGKFGDAYIGSINTILSPYKGFVSGSFGGRFGR